MTAALADKIAIERRKTHFSSIDLSAEVYLDHVGSALPSSVLLRSCFEELSQSLIANPHSAGSSQSAYATAVKIANVRKRLLEEFHCSNDFEIIFTSGTTASLKLVAESFPFTQNSEFITLAEAHTSVLGMRRYALEKKASWKSMTEEQVSNWAPSSSGPNLVVLPSQCNWGGYRPNVGKLLSQLSKVSTLNAETYVMIDAAAFLGTAELDLQKIPEVSFVALSFYKWLGYPTGLGCLIARKSALRILQKRFFGGGTIESALSTVNWEHLRKGHDAWEDGTSHFQGILALSHGLSLAKELRPDPHDIFALAKYLVECLRSLKHENGLEECVVYGWPEDASPLNQGPTIAFNCRDIDGNWIGYSSVSALAQLAKIHVRTGCFCNPGACAKYLGLTNDQIKSHHEMGHVCWDDRDIIDGYPTGAVRASLGPHTTLADLDRLIGLVHTVSSNANSKPLVHTVPVVGKAMTLDSLTIYPIKSCRGFSVRGSWPISETGLLLDRAWALVDEAGSYLTLKQNPILTRVSTKPDIQSSYLTVSFPGKDSIDIPLLDRDPLQFNPISEDDELIICGRSVQSRTYRLENLDSWFQDALQLPGVRLVRAQSQQLNSDEAQGGKRLLANDAQLLVMGTATLSDLNSKLVEEDQVTSNNFRPNLVVVTDTPYEEDNWKEIRVGTQIFRAVGPCARCKTICINENTLTVGVEPLRTLMSYRRVGGGKVNLGMLFDHVPELSKSPFLIDAGDPITILQ